MPKIFLYNTLTRKKEEFKPVIAGQAGMYTCGPTVYNFAHIGNLRAYVFEDVLERVLAYNGYAVKRVMNITDVGHLTGDMDMGEDKMEKGAKREGKSAWEVAEFYTQAFLKDLDALNIKIPELMPKATDYIKEQIALVKILEEKGYTYAISDGIYFDTSKFPDYAKLNHKPLQDLLEGARVEINEEKRNATDFALWKFSPPGEKRQMEWDSPWGVGFPGWHIECSAMSQALLGEQLDIHCGGVDHIDVHHTNEIAQSEAAYGRPFFNCWLHCAFLNIEGGKKMAKSEGNFLTLENAFVKKGMDPLVYRFACLQTHYRKPMEYGEEKMKNAQRGYQRLLSQARELCAKTGDGLSEPQNASKYKDIFLAAINDDLNTPQALAALQELLRSDTPDGEKLALILDFDRVLGLGFASLLEQEIPKEISALALKRDQARQEKNWALSDKLRQDLEALGWRVEDGPEGTRVYRK